MKLLIADDQESIHVYLNNCLPWAELGFSRILHTKDGLETIELIRKERPELIMLDIQMPVMNGLEVLEQMRKSHIGSIVVILSAFAEFNYAQTAIRYGVTEYLLKPIDRRDLRRTIDASLTQIFAAVAQKLRDILLYSSNDCACLQSLPFAGAPYRGCLITDPEEDAHGGAYAALIVRLPGHRAFRLLPSDEALSLSGPRPGTGSMLAVSGPHTALNAGEVRAALAECETVVENALFYRISESRLVYTPDPDPAACVREFLSADSPVPAGHAGLAALREISGRFFDRLAADRPGVECALASSSQLLQGLLGMARFDAGGLDIESGLTQSASLDELRAEFDKLLAYACEKPACRPAIQDSTVAEIVRYLENNYLQDFSLDDLAKRFYVNKFELCRRFKQHTGINIWPYITSLRIEHAKHLLSTTDMKVYEISEACCFNSPTYFSTVFKKQTGIAPQQWNRP